MKTSVFLPIDTWYDIPEKVMEHSCSSNDLLHFLPASVGGGLVLVAILMFLLYLVHIARESFNRITDRYLSTFFVVTWFVGFLVYDIGTYTGEWPALFWNMPMAVLHAFGMFLLDSDVSAIHEEFHNSWVYMACFSVAHFCAAVISLIFVIRHFGFNIIAWSKMFFRSRVSTKKSLYIFWGMNDATYHLAADIKKTKEAEGDDDYRIVVVRTSHDSDSAIGRNGMERLFNFLSLNNRELDRLQELKCLTTNTFSNLSNVSLSAGKKSRFPDIIGHQLGLNTIIRLIVKRTTGDVHMFFLSSNEQDNIIAVANLRYDKTINDIAKPLPDDDTETSKNELQRKVTLYCRARYNSVHRVIEDAVPRANLLIKVVDTPHISVELLRSTAIYHPVNFVDINADATVSTKFNALIVGLGEVGWDMVRFLYEFGSFVKSGTDGERSDFHIDVIDKNMDEIAGVFIATAPSLPVRVRSHGQTMDRVSGEPLITLHSMDARSVDFYQIIEKNVSTLNYIVVAMDDDEANISLAVRLVRLALRQRDDLSFSNFCVMVRVLHDEDGHVRRIAEYYNRLWAAQRYTNYKDAAGNLIKNNQETITKTARYNAPIVIFGSEREAFTYDNILNDRILMDAKRYYERYLMRDTHIESRKRKYEQDAWDKRHGEMMQTNNRIKYSPTYSGVMALRRMESQDIANSMHKATKQILYDKAKDLWESEHADKQGWKEAETRIIDTLAQTEHLRWNASHELLGYQCKCKEGEKNETKMWHGCLRPWCELTKQMKGYDYEVVRVSLES